MLFLCKLSGVNPLKYISINNQEFKIRPEFVNVNTDGPVFFSF